MANNERFRNHLGNCTGGRRRSPSSVLDDERVRYGCSETVLLLVRRVFAAARCLASSRGRGITGAYLHDRGRTAPALVGYGLGFDCEIEHHRSAPKPRNRAWYFAAAAAHHAARSRSAHRTI